MDLRGTPSPLQTMVATLFLVAIASLSQPNWPSKEHESLSVHYLDYHTGASSWLCDIMQTQHFHLRFWSCKCRIFYVDRGPNFQMFSPQVSVYTFLCSLTLLSRGFRLLSPQVNLAPPSLSCFLFYPPCPPSLLCGLPSSHQYCNQSINHYCNVVMSYSPLLLPHLLLHASLPPPLSPNGYTRLENLHQAFVCLCIPR